MLTFEIKQELLSHGASLVGFADVSTLPVQVTGNFPRAISIATALNPQIVHNISKGPTKEYFAEYERVNDLLADLCERAVEIIKRAGKRAEAFKATTKHFDPSTLSVRLQHKTIATQAGLGWIGKSALLITKQYGPAIRLGTVLTNAELEIGKPIKNSQCGQCRNCMDACPANAIAGKNWESGAARESIYNAFTCRETAKELSKRQGITATICGICINACPWTQKYISNKLTC
ncbi:MAG: epoxyqueuosine reductase [Sedimentisphaerales bacterium]|nr:epoxyqueuosine reductase [Sedimentisphaerales bacterium]